MTQFSKQYKTAYFCSIQPCNNRSSPYAGSLHAPLLVAAVPYRRPYTLRAVLSDTIDSSYRLRNQPADRYKQCKGQRSTRRLLQRLLYLDTSSWKRSGPCCLRVVTSISPGPVLYRCPDSTLSIQTKGKRGIVPASAASKPRVPAPH